MFQDHFYHSTIRTYIKVFGAIFDSLKIKRGDKTIEVPIAWASGQKYNIRNEQNADPNLVRFRQIHPRMSYEMTGFARDVPRVKNKFNQITNFTSVDEPVKSQYMRVPYTFNFRLDVIVQYFDDLLQIMEQLVVYFNPTIQVVVKDNPSIDGETALTITLLDNPFEDRFEGSFEDKREISATLNFTLEGFLYMPTSSSNIIKRIELNYKDLETEILAEQDVITPDE